MNIAETDKKWIKEALNKFASKMETVVERNQGKIPYTTDDEGRFDDRSGEKDICWWTNGFWGGELWQLYKLTGKEIFRQEAISTEDKMDAAFMNYNGMDHDAGFRWLPTSVVRYKLEKNDKSKNRALLAAANLAGRFNLNGKFIRAWNDWGDDRDTTGWAIIDCMMNLPLLYWASEGVEFYSKYIELWNLGDDFKKWFEEACGVYATLVDRIVPGFPRKEIAEIQEKISYRDNLVVQAENFHLWVIEAPKEVAEEFPADKAGLHVLFVPSEEPYHKRKVTLLNGPHTVLSPVAFLSGVNIVRDACNHEVIGKYIHKVQFEELMQTLDLPMDELEKFAGDVLERFDNPYVDHQVTSIMLNSFPKFQARDLPGVKTFLERKGELPKGLVFGLAAIITYYKGGKREDGVEIVPNDDQKIMDLLKELWATGDTQKVTDGVLGAEFIWQEDLNKVPGLNAMVKQDLDLIKSVGMLEAVKSIL